jgi:predicted ATPase/class 3 adenylate cyclase
VGPGNLLREIALLYDGVRTRVVRGLDEDGRRVVLKSAQGAALDLGSRARMRREHDLLVRVAGRGAPKVVGMAQDGSPALLLEDVGAVALSAQLEAVRATVETALRTSLGIVDALAEVHGAGVLHRDLNPSNIVRSIETGQVWLIDFDLASAVPSQRSTPRPMQSLEGTPAYLAPEQTGRMNRVVDARADLYALGATLYEIFAGRPPFVRASLLEYAHAHLALAPPRLEPIVRGVPDTLVDLVMTLLAKRPEDRYQSAAGVAIDLRGMLAAASFSGPPPLRGRTVSLRPELPQELIGREAELARLRSGFDVARAGGRAIALIAGHPGIGKTSLVRELHRPITVAGGLLLEGKFDAFTRDLPYAAITQVLDAFANEVLAGSEAVVQRWREAITSATTPSTGLVSALSPRMQALLGPTPAVVELGPTEAERRMQATLLAAFRAIAGREQPIVVFLDDLQWADLPSLLLLERAFRDTALQSFMLALAWRDNEIGAEHALRTTLKALDASDANVERVTLGPLRPADVARLVASGLGRSAESCAALVTLLYEKTAGNPFYLRRLVEEAATTGALRFDAAAMAWTWDDEAVRRLAITDNVVDLLRGELARLSPDARRCVSTAALIGDRFDLSFVVLASGLSHGLVAEGLASAIEARLVTPLEATYWAGASRDAIAFRFAFVHDRVQEAARSLLSDEERLRVHLAIARAASEGDETLAVFQAAEHYGEALALVHDEDERQRAREIATAAGARALSSSAHAAASRFLETAVSIAGVALWERDPVAARDLWVLAARAAWMMGDERVLDERVLTLRHRAMTDLDRLGAESVVVQSRIARGQPHEALDAAIAALNAAGVALPRHPSHADVGAAVGAALGLAASVDVLALKEIGPDDEIELAARRLLVLISSAAYVAEPNLLPLVACHLVSTTVQRGASSESAYGFAVFALVLAAGWLLEPGVAQGKNALALLGRFPTRLLDGMVRHVVNHYPRAWSDPLRAIYEENPAVHRTLMEVGDLEYAGWVAHMRVVYGFLSAVHLEALAEEAAHALDTMKQSRHAAAIGCTDQFDHLVRALRGQLADPTRLRSDTYDEDAALAAHRAVDFRGAVLALASCMVTARTFFGDHRGAVEALEVGLAYQDGAVAIYYQVSMRAYGAVATLIADGASALDRVASLRAPILACATFHPESGAHYLALVDAELARVKHDPSAAVALYDAAIEQALAIGFVHDAGLACERAASLQLERGARRAAAAYLVEARSCWIRWGALGKVAQLEELHGALIAPFLRLAAAGATTSRGSSRSSQSEGELDLASLLKASQAIAEEVDLDALLRRSMRILVESMGASRGVFLLARRGELVVEATCDAEGDVSLETPPVQEAVVPLSIVRRVFRSGELEVHDDTLASKMGDPYFEAAGTRSALCAPVVHSGRVLGVLWFENTLSAGAFTQGRVRILDVLGPQLAVSIRNARLVAAQDRFVPSQFIRSLGRSDIVDVEVGDHSLKEVSVFFSDIRAFTTLVEQLSAAEALAFINRYLSFAEPEITAASGFVDTYLGDGIMALFDSPESNATDAVRGAVRVHRALDRYNTERRRLGEKEIHTGIGINTGVVTMGMIGGQSAVKCGVVGDAVNLASRIEGLTGLTGSRLLISESTHARLASGHGLSLRRAGRVRVKGREQPIVVYEVIDAEIEPIRAERLASLAQYEAAMEAFLARDFQGARAKFATCIGMSPGDALAARFFAWAAELALRGVPEGWDGTIDATSR